MRTGSEHFQKKGSRCLLRNNLRMLVIISNGNRHPFLVGFLLRES